MLRGFILAVHVLLAFMIVVLVLLQRGKGAEAGALGEVGDSGDLHFFGGLAKVHGDGADRLDIAGIDFISQIAVDYVFGPHRRGQRNVGRVAASDRTTPKVSQYCESTWLHSRMFVLALPHVRRRRTKEPERYDASRASAAARR